MSQSSVLAVEHPRAEVTCSDARPKSQDEKWGLGVPNREKMPGEWMKIAGTTLYLAPALIQKFSVHTVTVHTGEGL